jgi:hypothetical protein
MEATGGRAVGQLAPTAVLAAQLLARCGAVVRPDPRPVPKAEVQNRSALLARRQQVITMLVAALASRRIAPGCGRRAPSWLASYAARSARARPGARTTNCSGAGRASGRCAPRR